MQATIVCALVVEADACQTLGTEALESGQPLHWWRDGPVHDGDPHPFEPLLRLFDTAEVIVAYNGLDFDFPLLFKHYDKTTQGKARYFAHRAKCFDPFQNIRAVYDHWPKLDALLQDNSIPTKLATGLEAILMWERGDRTSLLEYCAQDVKAMAQLCLRGDLQYRYLRFNETIPAKLVDARCAVAAHRAASDDEFVLVR
tara:strand:+ start:156 stop:752 length:597 start_codon:yes stop_codon:yes gene_type:complete